MQSEKKLGDLDTMSPFISKLDIVSKFISRNTFPASALTSDASYLSSLNYWLYYGEEKNFHPNFSSIMEKSQKA